MTRQLATSIVTTSYGYVARLHRDTTVGMLASYLSQLENAVSASSMELAQTIPLDMRVQEINLQAGNRLLIANDPIKVSELPVSLASETAGFRIIGNEIALSVPRKTPITFGWTDKPGVQSPDIDLRRFVSPDVLAYISQSCMTLSYQNQQWFIQRTGETGIVVDELELTLAPLPLNQTQVIQLFLPGNPYPVSSFRIEQESLSANKGEVHLQTGATAVMIQPGVEEPTQFLRASGRLTLRQIVAGLAQHHALSLAGASVYVARPLPIQMPLHELDTSNSFLHVTLDMKHARRVLMIKDAYHTNLSYPLRGGRSDKRISLGWRQVGLQNSSLDIDLTASLLDTVNGLYSTSAVKAQVSYMAFSGMWTIRKIDNQIDIYLEDKQVGDLPIRISIGDRLTFTKKSGDVLASLSTDILVE